MASEDYKESEISKIVKRLMDEEGFEFGEAVKEAMEQTKNFESKADGGAIGIEVLFTDKMKDGGRAGFFMGGPALEGQALAIYNSMSAYGAGDQEIADRLQALGYYDPNASTPDTPDTGNTIGYQGGDNSPVSLFGENLNQTYTKENVSPTGGEMTQQLLTLDEKKDNPAFMSTIPNPEDYPYSGPVQQFSQIGPNLYDVNPEGTVTADRTYKTPRTIGDQVYAASQSDGLGSISKKDLYDPSLMSKGITAVQDFFGKFSSPKVKGTLGDRLLKQSQTMTIPTLAGAFAKLRSPFNPQSPTYNAALPMQLNFLEATTGKKITGTSDNLKVTEGLGMVGRDPNSGLLKYGSGSVLAGKNVISGFGSNDYETALNKYLTRMLSYTNPTKFQQAKIQQARDELAALQAKKEQEYIDSGTQASVKALQKEIDSGKYSGGSDFAKSNQAAVGGGSTAKNKQGQTAAQATKAGTGTSQGYSQHYARGGLATMFTRRR